MDADFTDGLMLLTNTPVQAEYLLHSLELVARDIILYINSDKTELMCFKQDNASSTLNHKPLKLDHFTYLSSKYLKLKVISTLTYKKAMDYN